MVLFYIVEIHVFLASVAPEISLHVGIYTYIREQMVVLYWLNFSHLVSLWSFDKQQRKLDTEICKAGQLRQTCKQSVVLIDL